LFVMFPLIFDIVGDHLLVAPGIGQGRILCSPLYCSICA
jgi:hypothetical protein